MSTLCRNLGSPNAEKAIPDKDWRNPQRGSSALKCSDKKGLCKHVFFGN
jgi:hypothetical protein